jgi:hypothetical protein
LEIIKCVDAAPVDPPVVEWSGTFLWSLLVISCVMAENVLVWNVRGLNARAHHNAVCELVGAEHVSLVCLQETKLESILDYNVMQLLGVGFDYFFLPAMQTRGRILVVWHANSWVASNPSSWQFFVFVISP